MFLPLYSHCLFVYVNFKLHIRSQGVTGSDALMFWTLRPNQVRYQQSPQVLRPNQDRNLKEYVNIAVFER